MAHGFKPSDHGTMVVARLDENERSIVTGLMEQVLELVRPEDSEREPARDPFEEIAALFEPAPERGPWQDPALERLFPRGHRDDEQAAAEFRRLTEPGLRTRKAENLRLAVEVIRGSTRDRVELTRPQADAVLTALTDVRLVLGERLGLRTDDDAAQMERLLDGLDPDDPLAYALAVYDFLTWLQESLVRALMP